MSDTFIPFHVPSIGEEEINEVVDTMRSGWLTTGPRAARLEHEFSEYVDVPYAVAVNSATAGLHLALAGLGVGPGDEVITTPMTFCATVQAILHVGATPVLADIGSDGNIDPEKVKERITRRTRAIIPVHLAGLPCEMQAIWGFARSHDIAVIEDAAHAAGARYIGRPIGAGATATEPASDAVAFSFYATKNMTTGEGGMITTHRPALADTMRMLSIHGASRGVWNRYTENGSWHYDVLAHGFKYNLSDIQAAIGIHQLQKLEHFVERRAAHAQLYNSILANVEEVELPPDHPWTRHAWHLYMLRLNLERLKIDRAVFIRELHERGIGTSVHFIPIPLHPFFAQLPFARECPRAIGLYHRIISLPLYPAMSPEQVQYVAQCVQEVAERSRRARYVGLGVPAVTGSNAATEVSAPLGVSYENRSSC